MSKLKVEKFYHVCPRNCFSGCTMISTVENGKIVDLTGDPDHPYTKGKLCLKGHAYIENNYHPDRLKYPYYQEVKGSGKFKKITWEMAFQLIMNEMLRIYEQYGNFLPIGLYKYSGNFGVLHFATEHFFSSLGGTTTLVGSPCTAAGTEGIMYDTGFARMPQLSQLSNSKLIIIWGKNPAVTNTHLIQYIIKAKLKGAKVVVIDPIYTKTAEHADLYIQIYPSTDGALANALIKSLAEKNALDDSFINNHAFGFQHFKEQIDDIQIESILKECDIREDAYNLLLNWLVDAPSVSHIVGLGLQRRSNGGQNVRAIHALAAARGDIGKENGGFFYGHGETYKFTNQHYYFYEHLNKENRIFNMNEWIKYGDSIDDIPIEMMWISCRNPLVQDPQPQLIKKHLEKIPFVVTVDQFMTPTAKMSNLVLPTTTLFENADIVTSFWQKQASYNEKAVAPYYESRSDWNIMRELAIRLNEYKPNLCSFPVHSSEEEYLNSQFNEEVYETFGIKNIDDLKGRTVTAKTPDVAWEDFEFPTKTKKFQFFSPEAKENGFNPLPVYEEGVMPPKEYPFWLFTPHQLKTLNSQFHFLLNDEPFVAINPKVAEMRNIFDGEIVKVFNEVSEIEIKAVYDIRIPKDILLIYQGWYRNSNVCLNTLVPVLETDMGEMAFGAKGVAFYDTFVNIEKL